jgi:thiol-disulfide isomerase/thioredoxin
MRCAVGRIVFLSLAAGLSCVRADAAAATTPAPAEALLTEARTKAAAAEKVVLVHFSASWCSWCRRLETFLHDAAIEPILGRHFVLVRLVVRERAPSEPLNNPGGMDVLTRLGGADRGIPFSAIVAPDGTILANSLVKVDDPNAAGGMQNLGYPGDETSIRQFLDMLQKAAPKLSDRERETLAAWLVAHQPN